mmetsp:Transcript_22388/g.44401  ORF Transcript_22388/g.44401 Transcript_22388/m.44401 type:complete len:579 (+) Transcript_22388:50-1786(+)
MIHWVALATVALASHTPEFGNFPLPSGVQAPALAPARPPDIPPMQPTLRPPTKFPTFSSLPPSLRPTSFPTPAPPTAPPAGTTAFYTYNIQQYGEAYRAESAKNALSYAADASDILGAFVPADPPAPVTSGQFNLFQQGLLRPTPVVSKPTPVRTHPPSAFAPASLFSPWPGTATTSSSSGRIDSATSRPLLPLTYPGVSGGYTTSRSPGYYYNPLPMQYPISSTVAPLSASSASSASSVVNPAKPASADSSRVVATGAIAAQAVAPVSAAAAAERDLLAMLAARAREAELAAKLAADELAKAQTLAAAAAATTSSSVAGHSQVQHPNLQKALALVEALLVTGDKSALDYVSDDTYVQHNLDYPSGKAHLRKVITGVAPNMGFTNHRAFVDGDFVILHNSYDYNPFVNQKQVGFEIFRFEDGLIVEHWDNLQDLVSDGDGTTQVSGPTEISTDASRTEQTRKFVLEVMQKAFVQGHWIEALDLYWDKDKYTQHSQGTGKDISSLENFVKQLSGPAPFYKRVITVFAQGDHALAVSEGLDGMAYYDLFKVGSNGKLVEHWDVIQEIPPVEAWANSNGKF